MPTKSAMDAVTDHELETRLGKLEVTVSHVASAVDRLAMMMEQRSHTNWGVIASWAAVLLSLGVALYWPVNEKMNGHSASIAHINEQLIGIRTSRWTVDDHFRYEQRQEDEMKNIEEDIRRLERQMYGHEIEKNRD